MRILVSGASGLVGTAAVKALTADGHSITRLVRNQPSNPGEVRWDPAAAVLEPSDIDGHDAVLHLAGENIATGRWTAEKKRRIRQSRVDGTELLCGALAATERPPSVFIGASAIGYYGAQRGDEVLVEDSPAGDDFLAEVCAAWESASEACPAQARRVILRLGVVLSAEGGMLEKLLPIFRLGLGGRVGSGRQYFSWIAIDDVVGVIRHALEDGGMHGVHNTVSPEPVTNASFTQTLARVLRRPAWLPVPAFALRLALGEMGEALPLSSNRVLPRALSERGYRFVHPRLEPALHSLLGANHETA